MQLDLFSDAVLPTLVPVQKSGGKVDNTLLSVPGAHTRSNPLQTRTPRAWHEKGAFLHTTDTQTEAEAHQYPQAALNSRAAMRRAGLPWGDLTVQDAEARLRQISPVSDIAPVGGSETDIGERLLTVAAGTDAPIYDWAAERKQRLKAAQSRLNELPLNGPEYLAQLGVVADALREVRNV